jgi:Tfp pilus assembly protein PilV
MRTRRQRGGSSLIEIMIAGAVLLLGLVGVAQLLISGMSFFTTSDARSSGQTISAAGVAQLEALPFQALAVGTSDGGIIYDSNGRRFGRVVTVTDVGDGGVQARRVVVRTDWRDALAPGGQRFATATVVLSEVPDANF